MTDIKCYSPNYTTGNIAERYVIPSSTTAEIVFKSRTLKYAVTQTSFYFNDCITSAEASYSIKFNSDKEGKTSYDDFNVSTGCSIEINEATGAGAVDVPFGFSALEEDSQNLYWTIDSSGYLILENSASFKGTDNPSPLCNESCKCYWFFQEKSS